MKISLKTTMGWAAAIIAIFFTCVWAFWGIIENFHEGWYHTSWSENLGLMFIQYLSPFLIFYSLTLLSIWKNQIGAIAFLAFGLFLSWFVNNSFVYIPFLILAVLFFIGDQKNQTLKYRLALYLPLIVLVLFAIEPIYRVSGRINDGDFSMKTIPGNQVTLTWAPRGPGWPDDGMNWYEADSICRHLSADGLLVLDTPQNIWRLPKMEEAVRSMQRHGENSKGYLQPDGTPSYDVRPDKETPLWNPNTKVIYWWTKTEIDSTYAWMIVYDGKIWPRQKSFGPNYLGFRAVKD